MTTTKKNTTRKVAAFWTIANEMEAAKKRAAKMDGQVWAESKTRLVVYFPSQEQAYLYELAPEQRHHYLPGRPVVTLYKLDASEIEFRAACERLVW